MSDADEARPGTSPWIWGVPLLIVLVLLIATFFVIKGRERDVVQAAAQRERFQMLADTVRRYAAAHDGAMPQSLDDPQVLLDSATGQQGTYRVPAPGGTPIAIDPVGDYLIAWSPAPSYRGRRAVVTNDLSVLFVPDDKLDLKAGRLKTDEGLRRVRDRGQIPRSDR